MGNTTDGETSADPLRQSPPDSNPGYAISEEKNGDDISISASFPEGLVDLSFINFILKILTLGIYSFWARTEVRKSIWSAVRLSGEPLTYTGTGKELLLGFLIVFGAILLPVSLLMTGLVLYIGDPNSPIILGAQLSLSVAFFYLYGVAIYSAQRYVLARTTWRGIRGHLSGSAWRYGWTSFWTALPVIPTLGWAIPWRSTKLQKIITEDTRFGSTPLRFEGNARPLYLPFAVFWIVMLVILVSIFGLFGGAALLSGELTPGLEGGMSETAQAKLGFVMLMLFLFGYLAYKVLSAWYRARVFNYFSSQTKLQNASFQGRATGPSLVWLAVTNFLITIFTFGILSPVVLGRRTFYFVNRLSLEGPVDVDAIAQAEKQNITYGEGLAQALDIDVF